METDGKYEGRDTLTAVESSGTQAVQRGQHGVSRAA